MKRYKIKKLDARFNGYPTFSHVIEPVNPDRYAYHMIHQARIKTFLEIREWFWTTFGPSREILFVQSHDPTTNDLGWAWDSEHHHLRIYVKEKELNWFLLKWSE